jgi:sugar lactone lactonase YvrE
MRRGIRRMRKSVLLLASITLALLLAGGLAVAQSTSEVTTFYKMVDKWGNYGSSNGQFKQAQDVAIDSSGNVYVADYWNHRIQKFTSNGTFITKWGSQGSGNGEFSEPTAIAIDSSDNVYVAEFQNARIQKFTSDGTFITKWGSEGSGDGQFEGGPTDIATDSSGKVYVTNWRADRIQKFTSNGDFITKWTVAEPEGVAVDEHDNVYVGGGRNQRIQKFTSNGTFITGWGSEGSGDGEFDGPWAIATDSEGNVYVGEYWNSRVQKFTSDGTFITKWGRQGSADGQFDGVDSLAIDSSGNIYAADVGNHRVQKFAEVPLSADTTAPTTRLSTWSSSTISNSSLSVRLAAIDINGSGVKQITYEATGAQPIASTTIPGDDTRVTFNAEGKTTLTYFATDLAGNTEQPQSRTIIIDKTPPRVKSTLPQNGATGVAPSAMVKATFSERMIASTITTPTRSFKPFRLVKEGTTTDVPATITYDQQTRMATLDPAVPLEAGATYKAIVGGLTPHQQRRFNPADLAWNRMDQNLSVEGNQRKVWRFTVSN